METISLVENYFGEVKGIADEISKEKIADIVNALYEAWKRGSHIYIIGNGGSASTATHFKCDLEKSTIVEGKQRFRATALVDNIPLVSALVNDNGWSEVYVEQLKNVFNKKDVVIAISVHGSSGKDKAGLWSQNLLKAMQFAKDNGGVTIGMAGFDGGVMKDVADYCIVVPKDSTPHVESFHVVIAHLICQCLKEKIEKES